MADPVVTVTPSIMDGTVVRWHRDLLAATEHRAVLSASRKGVQVHGGAYLNAIPEPWIGAAMDAWRRLADDRDADLSGLATHRPKGMFGPLEPIKEEGR